MIGLGGMVLDGSQTGAKMNSASKRRGSRALHQFRNPTCEVRREKAYDNNHEARTIGPNEVERRAACDTDRARSNWVRNEQTTLRVGVAATLGSNAIDQAMMRRAKNEQAMLRVGTAASAKNNASCEGACEHETRVMPETLVGLHLQDVDTLPGLARVGATRGLFH